MRGLEQSLDARRGGKILAAVSLSPVRSYCSCGRIA